MNMAFAFGVSVIWSHILYGDGLSLVCDTDLVTYMDTSQMFSHSTSVHMLTKMQWGGFFQMFIHCLYRRHAETKDVIREEGDLRCLYTLPL